MMEQTLSPKIATGIHFDLGSDFLKIVLADPLYAPSIPLRNIGNTELNLRAKICVFEAAIMEALPPI